MWVLKMRQACIPSVIRPCLVSGKKVKHMFRIFLGIPSRNAPLHDDVAYVTSNTFYCPWPLLETSRGGGGSSLLRVAPAFPGLLLKRKKND